MAKNPAAAGDAPVVSVGPLDLGSSRNGAKKVYGVRVALADIEMAQPEPVNVVLSSGRIDGRGFGYGWVDIGPDGFSGVAEVHLSPRATLLVVDKWRAVGEVVRVSREVSVIGEDQEAFMTSLTLARNEQTTWGDVQPFAPGAIYGDAEPVPRWSIGSPYMRRNGAKEILCREDRLSAPMFALRYGDGKWASVSHEAAGAATIEADRGLVEGGEILVDERLAFASLGGIERDGRLYVGAYYPGTEGPVTYSTGPAPLGQYLHWRRRFHPLKKGFSQRYELTFESGRSASNGDFFVGPWRRAWRRLEPQASLVDRDEVITACTDVLAGQVRTYNGLTGVPLEVDALTGDSEPGSPAIMGFVGANTDAGFILLRVGERLGGSTGSEYVALGDKVLDSFVSLLLAPPRGEGFDLQSGRSVTYRSIGRYPAVYARSVADGCAGTLKAWEHEAARGRDHPRWLAWAQSGGDWLASSQGADGSFPRAWEAGTGLVIDASTTASHVPIAFMARLAAASGQPAYLEAALRAGEFCWGSGGKDGYFAGATLDNPDVVDKEAAIFALEGFLELHGATGDDLWLKRAVTAASVAETWVYIWDVAMPVDAEWPHLHWKPGVPTIGEQLIATGVSTCDGFLAMNAAAFARLYLLTGDEHFVDVARLVTHGTKAMLGLPGRHLSPLGPGWQQEHWCLSIPRGLGLSRHWLPWVAVANVEGILRLEDLGAGTADLVLGPRS
jgi:hypothetical protein